MEMATCIEDNVQSSQSSENGDSSQDDSSEFAEFEDCEFHDCMEMNTIYLSFDAQDMPTPPKEEFAAEDTEHDEFNEAADSTEHNTSESEAFYSCDSQPKVTEAEGEEVVAESVEQSCMGEERVVDYGSVGEQRSSIVDELMEKRRCAFAPRRVESFQDEARRAESNQDEPARAGDTYEARTYMQGMEATSLQLCSLSDSFNREQRSNAATEMNSTPDMLVTLTTTDMGISAKREDSMDPPTMPLNMLAQSAAEDVWTMDSIQDSSIFDKARLVEEALDTADINKCMAGKADRQLPTESLPGLRIQEQYSDELRPIGRNHRSSSSSLPQVYHALPSYRMEAVRTKHDLARAHSAPMDMEDANVMAEDVEISSILGNVACFSPLLTAEDRPISSLSAPDEEIIQTPQRGGCKKCLTSWVQKKMHFVSFDAESDAASITRSEFILDMKRGTERDGEESGCFRHHQQHSSRFGYINGFVIGPSVSPVPPGGIQDFSRDDAIALNALLRNDPQLSNIPMGEWTSKLIGFATPADYYVHMIHELSEQKINVLALIKARLGDRHPLVAEIMEKLRNYTTEVPSIIFGTTKGHRRTPPLASHQKLPLFAEESEDHHENLEAALIDCGIDTALFDNARCAFVTEHAYYEYISQQIKASDYDLTLPELKEHLGATHPFIDVFRSCVSSEPEGSNRTDSAKSIDTMASKSSPRVLEPPSPKNVELLNSADGSVLMECEFDEEFSPCSCFVPFLQRFRRSWSSRKTRSLRKRKLPICP